MPENGTLPTSSYDDIADVLYISLYRSLDYTSEEDGDGLLWRYDPIHHRIFGLTVIYLKFTGNRTCRREGSAVARSAS